MKKIALLISCVIFAMMSTVSAANERVLNTNGSIVAAWENRVVVQGMGNIDNIVLLLGDNTYLVDNATMQKLQNERLKKGDYVYAFYGANMTKSIPPQAKAVLLAVGKDDYSVTYMKISKVQDMGDYVKVFYANQSMDIDKKAMKDYKSIRKGDELLSWYIPTATVVPTSFKASYAMLLNRVILETTIISVLPGNILVNNKELPVTGTNKIYNVNGAVYLPLRPIVKTLGYDITWNAATYGIKLQNKSRSVLLQMGSRCYWRDKEKIVLENVPIMVDGQTLVPLEFFRGVINENVKIRR